MASQRKLISRKAKGEKYFQIVFDCSTALTRFFSIVWVCVVVAVVVIVAAPLDT
jgi:hypothetical protein